MSAAIATVAAASTAYDASAASASSRSCHPAAAAANDHEYGIGMDLDEWEAETTSKQQQPQQQQQQQQTEAGADSSAALAPGPPPQSKSEVTIETALLLPLAEIYFTNEELQRTAVAAPAPVAAAVVALAASSTAAVGGATVAPAAAADSWSSSSSPVFPLRILSERLKGIAFQLWPAAKVLSQFMRELQHDVHVADLAHVANYARGGGTKGSAKGPGENGEVGASAAAASVAAPAPVLKSAPAPMLPLLLDAASGLFWPGKRVLELGAGCGLVGMLAASLGASVTVTDMPAVVAHLRANVDANFGATAAAASALSAEQLAILHARCSAAALEWGVALPAAAASAAVAAEAAPLAPSGSAPLAFSSFDVILLSDCVYWEELFAPLVSTLRLLAPDARTVIFLCQSPRRPKIERRFYKLAEKAFRIEIVREVAAAHAEKAFRIEIVREVAAAHAATDTGDSATCSGEKRDVKLFRLQRKA